MQGTQKKHEHVPWRSGERESVVVLAAMVIEQVCGQEMKQGSIEELG